MNRANESFPRKGGKEEAVNRLAPDQRITVLAGEWWVTKQPAILSTLLGSCIAVCLYDPLNSVAGLNHFLLPIRGASALDPHYVGATGRYGLFAMEILINNMLKAGALKPHLRAKIFGGGAMLLDTRGDRGIGIGEANARFAREYLDREGIIVDSQDVGGTRGRVIYFHTDTFAVWRRFIKDPVTLHEVIGNETELLDKVSASVKDSGTVRFFS